MTNKSTKASSRNTKVLSTTFLVAMCVSVSACKHAEDQQNVTGWSLVDPAQRHPIMVSEQPAKLSLRVGRGSHGLSPHQRAQVVDFTAKYRAGDAGNSRLVIAAPSGSANEVAAMQAVAELRHLMREAGFGEASISVEAYHDNGDPQPPIRISYKRYVAEAPECGLFPANLTMGPQNAPHANLGCATQRNLANQVANPGDLVTPRTMTAASGDRRDVVFGKYVKGEATESAKQSESGKAESK
jgi:pilus assembly protein CpaD